MGFRGYIGRSIGHYIGMYRGILGHVGCFGA